MRGLNSLLSAGVKLTSTGTAVASPIPFDSSGYFPKFVRVVATGAGCYVKVGGIGVTAVSGDCMVQPLDGIVLDVSGCKAISAISVTGTSSVTVVPLERGSWNYDQRTLDYAFTSLTSLPSSITFSRGSGGGAFGSDGLYKWYGYNLLLQSQNFGTTWVLSSGLKAFGSGSTLDATTAPDGTVTADLITEDTATTVHRIAQSGLPFAAQPYTFSCYVKPNGKSIVGLRIADGVTTFGVGLNTSTLTAVALTSGETAPTTQTVTSVGNGWFRVSMTCTVAVSAAGVATVCGVSGTTTNYTGDGVSGYYLWGAQLELGSTASSYSPTTTAASGAPRFGYDPVTLAPRGLLIEEQRTNHETNTVAYTKSIAGDTVTQNAVAPDGTTTAYTILGDGTLGVHNVYQASVTPTSGNTYTVSVFLKAGTGSLVQLATSLAHSGANVYCNYNLSTEAMTAGAGIVSGSNFIIPVGNGWYRCGFSYVASATAAGLAITTGVITSISDTRLPTNTASTSYLRWGGQYESTSAMGSAPFATSYIPTTTASATRSADSASMTGTNFSSWWNASAGTLYTEFMVPFAPSATSRAINVQGTSVIDCMLTSGMVNQYKVNAAFFGPVGARSTNTVIKSIGAFDGTNTRTNVDGGTESSSANVPSGNTAIYFGSTGGSSFFLNCWIRRFTFYPVALPDATRKALTTA